MIKVGLIGCGFMGSMHANCYKNIEGVKLAAVADIRREKALEIADGAEIYSDGMDLIANADVDVIDICLPTFLHARYALAAMDKVKYLFVEKPVALTNDEAEKMLSKAAETGTEVQVGQVIRFWDEYVELKKIIDSGVYGKVINANFRRISPRPGWGWNNWLLDTSLSGGAAQDLHVHDTDYVLSVFGEPKSVNGIYNELKDNNDYIVSNLVYDGFSVTTTGGWFNVKFPFCAEFTAIFEEGRVLLKDGKIYKNEEEVDLSTSANDVSENMGINSPRADGYTAEIEYFLDCVKNDTPITRVTPESSEGSVRLVERILASCIKI